MSQKKSGPAVIYVLIRPVSYYLVQKPYDALHGDDLQNLQIWSFITSPAPTSPPVNLGKGHQETENKNIEFFSLLSIFVNFIGSIHFIQIN